MKKITTIVTVLMFGLQSYGQWTTQEINTNSDLSNVFFLNENIGWIYKRNTELYQGIIFKTIDGGNTWDSISNFQFGYGHDFSFVDSLNGSINLVWGAPQEFGIFKTIDGGLTWEMVVDGRYEHEFFNEDEGVLLDHENSFPFYITDNGGGTWELIDTLLSGQAELKSVGRLDFLNENIGFIIYSYGEGMISWYGILKTNDGGYTWEEKTCPYKARDLFFVDEENGYAQVWDTWDKGLYRTTDGAASWEEVYFETAGTVFFVTPETGWLLSNGNVMHTTDGGTNWETQYSGSKDLMDICFSDSLNGWIVGDNGLILHTNNGGTVGIDEIIDNQNKLAIYPNPTNEKTNINFQFELKNEVELSIRNLKGQKVNYIQLGQIKTGNYELNCADHPPGIYLIALKSGLEILTKKLIID